MYCCHHPQILFSSYSCFEEYFDLKYSSAGKIRAFLARLIFWPMIFSEKPPRKKPFYFPQIFLPPPQIYFLKTPSLHNRNGLTPVTMMTKSCTKILILPKIFPTRFRFTPYGEKILYKIFPRFSDGRKCALLAKS